MNRVDYLLERPFALHSMAERKEIKRLGPHQPTDIVITQHRPNVSKKHQNRKFVVSWFGKKKWLTVSESRKGLYCFPCLLFGGDTIWSRTGYYDLKHLSERIRRHECSSQHVNNCVQFKLFGQVDMEEEVVMDVEGDIKVELDNSAPTTVRQQYDVKVEVQKHDADAERNHHALSRMVDCMLFFCANNMAHRILSKSPSAEGLYTEDAFIMLVNFASALDVKLAEAVAGSSTFPLQASLKQQLLVNMLQVYREEIAKEISLARFVSLYVNDVTDIASSRLAAVVFRYLVNGKVVERLWGFVDITDGARLAETVLVELAKYDLEKKLIAQSYDGSLLVKGSCVHQKVRMLYPFANFVQGYAHPLTVMVQKASCVIAPVRLFFANLGRFIDFFVASERRERLLHDTCKNHGTYWNVESHPVSVVVENRQALAMCLNHITESEEQDVNSMCGTWVLSRLLQDSEFLFFMELFHLIMPFAEILNAKLLTTDISESSARKAVENFTTALMWISQNEIDTIVPNVVDSDGSCQKMEVSEDIKQAGREACDIIIWQMQELFEDVDSLLAFQLLDSNLFEKHSARFPEELLAAATNAYPMISKEKLKAELQVLYKVPYFTFPSGVTTMLDSIKKTDLKDDFSETCTLLEIAVVTPVITMETERCLETWKKTEVFLKSFNSDASLSHDDLNALSVLSVHSNLISSLASFHDHVVEKLLVQDNLFSDVIKTE